MGNREIKVAVIDAGPLIHLSEIKYLFLLQIFKTLYISDAVWQETVIRERLNADDINELGNTQRVTVSQTKVDNFIKEYHLENLHTGERECLCFCQQEQIPIILTDDLAVRDAAKLLNLIPVGSLGIIVKACREGFLSLEEAEHCINSLQNTSSLFVTRTIIEMAIEQLRQSL